MLNIKIKEKISKYLELFNNNFYVKGDAFEKGVGVPLECVTYKNGEPQFGYSGNGRLSNQSINIALSMYLDLMNS